MSNEQSTLTEPKNLEIQSSNSKTSASKTSKAYKGILKPDYVSPLMKELFDDLEEPMILRPVKKKKKKIRYKVYAPIQRDVYPKFFDDSFREGQIVREGYNIPLAIKFKTRGIPFFFFGRSPDNCPVGKAQTIDGHIAIFGGSGSGKTTSIAIPNLYTWRGTIFSFDFKGDLIRFGARRKRVKVLYLLRGQANQFWYDPFYFLRCDDTENLIQNARELAEAIIPLPPDIKDSFWIDAPRDILTGAIVYFFRLGKSFIGTMIEIKTTRMPELLKKILTDELAAVCVNPDLEQDSKMLAGISMELHNHISVFATDSLIQDVLSPSDDHSKEMLTWDSLALGDIFIRIDQSRVSQWGSVMRLMLVQLIRSLERRPEKYEPAGRNIPPTLLMLDEFPQYGKIDVITSSLKILRSKNVTFALFCQSLADLDETYGKITRCTILDNCPFKAILNASDAETQHYFSDLVGTVKVPRKGITENFDELGHPTGYSVSVNESLEPIIYPHEFASLQDIVLLHPGPERFCRIEKEMFFRNNPCQNLIEEEDKNYGNET